MNNLKKCISSILLISCLGCGSGGDGDGQTNSNPNIEINDSPGTIVNVGTNTAEDAADIINASNADDVLGLTNCCKRAQADCVGDGSDGLEDAECLDVEIAQCEEAFQADTLNAFIEECVINT